MKSKGILRFIVEKQHFKLKFNKTQYLLIPVYFRIYDKAVAFNTNLPIMLLNESETLVLMVLYSIQQYTAYLHDRSGL